MITKVLVDRVNFVKDVNEIRQQWLRDLFLYIGLEADWMLEIPRDQALDYMIDNDVEVIEYKDIHALKIKLDGEVIGEWAGPEFVLKEDESDESLYFEATIEHWSIIEENIDLK
jgi:hypothetical protein